MGLFSFLKRSPEKVEQVQEIKLEQLGSWINSQRESAFETANQRLIIVKNSIAEEKNRIKVNIQKLLDTELKNPNIPERAKQIREGNRTTYVQKVQALVQEINMPEFDGIVEFCNSFNATMTNFGDTTVKNYYVLQEFFENEASAIGANLRNLDSLIKEAKNKVL